MPGQHSSRREASRHQGIKASRHQGIEYHELVTEGHNQQRATISDDRGIERPLSRPPTRARSASRTEKQQTGLRLTLSAILALGMTALHVARKWHTSSLVWSDLILAAVLVGVLVLLWAVLLLLPSLWGETQRQKAKRLDLERDRCPNCAGPLNLRIEADGCRVCSCCGGAWKPTRGLWARLTAPGDPMRCGGCGYKLHDLPIHHDGRLICPECGWSRVVDAAAWNSSPRCWSCKRSLRGLPLVLGDRVQCPECGQWRSGLTEADVRPSDATVP